MSNKEQNDKATFGFLPLILLLVSPFACAGYGYVGGFLVVIIAIGLLAYGVFTGKTTLFG